MKIAAYCGTRNLYKAMIPAVRSLIRYSDVDKIYLLIEDDTFPYDLPVEVINVSGQKIFREDGPNYKCIWSYMALMRAALHRVFPQYDRILSLDVDTIVERDIAGLWDLPIDDYYLGGVREPEKSLQKQKLYVNAGVMLLNLKKLRDGKGDAIVEALNTRKYTWPEQDCINEFCAGQIYEMSPEYNQNDWTTPVENPGIIHYAGKRDYLNLPGVKKYFPMQTEDADFFAGKQHYMKKRRPKKLEKLSEAGEKISVILPVYNMEQTLKTAVDSILAQTYPNWELIIVDDGSTDGSGRQGDLYMEQDARITCIHQENRGVGAARNAGMSCASGEWLAFLDADDEYLPKCFEQMMQASEDADLVTCGIYAVRDRVLCKPYDEIHHFDGLPDGRDLDVLWSNYILPIVWAKLYRRSAVNEYFMTDITYGEDTLFNFKVLPEMKRITVIPEPGYLYHKQRDRLDRGMLEGARRQLEAAAAWLPEKEEILRRAYIAFIRSARFFTLNVLDSEELTAEEKEAELEFCGRMVRLPQELDHEEFLFPENLEWWRLLKSGKYEQASGGLRLIQERKKKRVKDLPEDEWIPAMRG